MSAERVRGEATQEHAAWFDDLTVLGKMHPVRAAHKLRELGDAEAADLIEREAAGNETIETFGLFDRKPRPWQHTAHTFGHIPLIKPGTSEMVDVSHAGSMAPDEGLRGSRVTITLTELRVADYPGEGIHHVLFDFYAQNRVEGENVEHVHFNQTFRAQEGEQVASVGYPIFIGLGVGGEGAALRCYTVNVKNDDDEAILSFIDSQPFRTGLQLATTAQPALAPLAGIAVGLTRMLASRSKNVAVQDFFMGLDFGAVAGGARLAEGTYVAVQIPERDRLVWDWEEWVYSPKSGRVVNRADPGVLIPFNYVSFGVRRYEGP
jgi:hypothetical protein